MLDYINSCLNSLIQTYKHTEVLIWTEHSFHDKLQYIWRKMIIVWYILLAISLKDQFAILSHTNCSSDFFAIFFFLEQTWSASGILKWHNVLHHVIFVAIFKCAHQLKRHQHQLCSQGIINNVSNFSDFVLFTYISAVVWMIRKKDYVTFFQLG